MVGAFQLGAGPGVENVVTVWTAVVGNPAFPVPAAPAKAVLVAATGAAQTFGADKVQQFLEIAILGASVDWLMVRHGSSHGSDGRCFLQIQVLKAHAGLSRFSGPSHPGTSSSRSLDRVTLHPRRLSLTLP